MYRGTRQELNGRDMEGVMEPRNWAFTAGSCERDDASAISASSSISVSSCWTLVRMLLDKRQKSLGIVKRLERRVTLLPISVKTEG